MCSSVLSGLRNKTTGNLKSHHLQAGVTALSVPPPLIFFQQYMKKCLFVFVIFKGTFGLFGGGGGHVPLRPPLGSGTGMYVRMYVFMFEISS